jgi:triacylglycerol lipase
MAIDFNATADRVRALGRQITPDAAAGSREIYGPMMDPAAADRAVISRDLSYGPDARHKLDLFQPKEAGAARPVIVFVHGGGFVRGDKHTEGSPFYSNIGLWAVEHGMIGVTITYRLAPEHPWPAGPEDLARLVAWLKDNVAGHGGDPERIFLMGVSAGCVHVASYVAFPQFHGAQGSGLSGAVLMSGIYDFASAERNDMQRAYFGADDSKWGQFSSLPGLVATDLPLLISISEYDPPVFEAQALKLVTALVEKNGEMPRFVRLMGHNHFTSDLHFNSGDDILGRQIQRFVAEQSAVAAADAPDAVRRAG